MSTFFSLVTELETLLEKLNTILAGADDETVEVNGVTKDSISKAISDNFAQINALARGRLTFRTKSLLDNYGAPDVEQLAEVYNDSAKEENGLYVFEDGAWIKSNYDPMSYAEYLNREYFIVFETPPSLNVDEGVVKYSGGFLSKQNEYASSFVLFSPSDIAEETFNAPISGSVSGSVMHYYDTSVDAKIENPIKTISSGRVIDYNPAFIPLGIYYGGNYTPINSPSPLDSRLAASDYPVMFMRRPILVDIHNTLGNSGPAVYIPRDIWISKGGGTNYIAANNELSNLLIGNYCAIPIDEASLPDTGTASSIYLDLFDNTYKKATHPAVPVTSSTSKFVPILNIIGYEDTWRSPSGFKIIKLDKLAGQEHVTDIYKSLISKNESTHITLIGDSITWGVGASDTATTEPRAHQLTDARDHFTSSTWANKLRKFCGSISCGQQNELSNSPGENTYSRTTLIDAYKSDIVSVLNSENLIQRKLGLNRDGPILKSHLELTEGKKLRFEFTGTRFDLIYTTQTVDEWDVYVDGVRVYEHIATGEASFQNIKSLSGFTFSKHTVEIFCKSVVFRLEAIRFNKTTTFTNNGLIGTSTDTWLPTGNVLSGGIPSSTTHLIIQLGTNDRALVANANLPEAPVRTSINLRTIIAWIRVNRPNAKICIMAPPMALANADHYENSAVYKASSDDIAREIKALANELKIGFIDNYSATNILHSKNQDFLADNLHLNDYGHEKVFENITKEMI